MSIQTEKVRESQAWAGADGRVEGIVTLTHHKLRQPQDIGSKTTSEYSIWWLGPSAAS